MPFAGSLKLLVKKNFRRIGKRKLAFDQSGNEHHINIQSARFFRRCDKYALAKFLPYVVAPVGNSRTEMPHEIPQWHGFFSPLTLQDVAYGIHKVAQRFVRTAL